MKAGDFLNKQEIQALTARSDIHGARLVLTNWLLIAGIMAAAASWSNPLSIVLAIIVLGGRQLGLAILMHEAGHKTLFKSPRANTVVGQWLCAFPILGDCDAYGASHRQHHRLAGTRNDPDLPNYQDYPISKRSFLRKLKRDISGQTGLKFLLGTLRGANSINMRDGESAGSRSALTCGLLCNALLLALLTLVGAAWLYLLWLAAYLISYPLLARIRQLAEHGNVPDLYDPDPRQNTRTTLPGLVERLILCPNYVNYHLEHHLLPSAPCYRLPALHAQLKQRGFYAGHEHLLAHGYWDVLQRAVPELGAART